MTPQELKNSILQLAIQGKLVDQRAEDGTAEELYRQIQEEKKWLVKEGKIKKEKPLPEITEEEVPFDIPESWMWIRVGQIASTVTKGTTPRGGNVSYLNSGIGFLRAENIAGYDKLDQTNLKYIDEETHFGSLKRSIIQANDILITIAGTLGRTGIVRKEDLPLNANQAVSIVRLVNPEVVNLLYLVYALNSPDVQKSLLGQRKITAIPNLTLEIIENCILPLPSLAEQKRIVAKIEELLPYIDRYEQAWSKLEDFNKRFPVEMQKSILQTAIQGKLVEQRPEEGTGEELYQQIQAEKQRLVKEGKIKKEKPLPEIAEEEVPFDIPESWKWTKVGHISVVQSSKRVFEKDYVSEGVPFFRSKEIGDLYRGEQIKTELFITREHYQQLNESFGVPQKGDILITSVGTIGNTWICDGREFYYKDGNITQICANRFVSSKFLEWFIHSPAFEKQALSTVAGTAYSALTIIKLKNIMIPLPPLAEQKRIVAKLKELLPLCERLK